MVSLKKIILLFLGDFFYDARCINMAFSILKSKEYHLTVLSESKERHKNPLFKNITFYKIKNLSGSPLKYWEYHKQIKSLLNNKKYDIIVAGDLFSLSGACTQKTKIIFDSREIYSELEAHINKPLHGMFWSIYEKHYLKRVHTIITTAKTDMNYLKHKYAQYKQLKFYNIFNFPSNKNNQCDLQLKKLFPIQKNHIIILYQGVLQKGRGLNLLIDLINITKDLSAIIIGDGKERGKYIKKINQYKINNRVFLINRVPYLELLQYTSLGHIGWLIIKNRSTSNLFALPNKLFEYTLMGLPVISSNLPNINPIIKKYNLGKTLKKSLSTTNILESIKEIKNNFQEYQKINQIIQKKFTWETQHVNFLRLLKDE